MRAVFYLDCLGTDNCARLEECRECQSPVKTETSNFGIMRDVGAGAAEVDAGSCCSRAGRVRGRGLAGEAGTVGEAFRGVGRGLPLRLVVWKKQRAI